MTLKVLELFGGIGACTAAMKRLGIDFEVVDYVEIDKYAVASYNAINGTNFTPQDVTKWDKDIKVDFIMHGSPCQDFSLAGVQKGGDKGSGTRSSLMYETVRIVEKLRPKYVCWENVANLLSEKHFHNFANYINALGELGYSSAYKVLNAKDYGIPQNRERVFTISVLGGASIDLFGHELDFHWPQPFPLEKRLKDLLEDKVDEKFYLSDAMLKYFIANTKKQEELGNGYRFEPTTGEGNAKAITTAEGTRMQQNYIDVLGNYAPSGHNACRGIAVEGVSPTVMDNHGSVTAIAIKNATEQGYLLAEEGDGVDISTRMEHHRGTVQKGMTQTLTTAGGTERGVVINDKKGIDNRTDQQKRADYCIENNGPQRLFNIYGDKFGTSMAGNVWEKEKIAPSIMTAQGGGREPMIVENGNLRIRKLTPRECWRLMGRTDDDFEKAEKVCSNSQLYKQAGNSIVVDVLVYLFGELFRQYPTERNENG